MVIPVNKLEARAYPQTGLPENKRRAWPVGNLTPMNGISASQIIPFPDQK